MNDLPQWEPPTPAAPAASGWGAPPAPPPLVEPGPPPGGAGSGWWQAPKPGPIPLRPLGVGEILDGAIAVVRDSARVMLGLTALVALVTNLLGYAVTQLLRAQGPGSAPSMLSPAPDAGDAIVGSLMSAIPAYLLSSLALVILTGILTFAVSRAVLGEKLDISRSWAGAKPRLMTLLLASLLFTACLAILAAVCFGPSLALLIIGDSPALAGLFFLIGGPLFLVLGLGYLSFVFSITSPVIVLENKGVLDALRRTVKLLHGRVFWRAFGLYVLIVVMTTALGFFLSAPFLAVMMILEFATPGETPGLVEAVGAFAETVVAIVTWPFTAAATALVYLDVRMRREGLDLALHRAVGAGGPAPAGVPPYGRLPGFPATQPSAPPPDSARPPS